MMNPQEIIRKKRNKVTLKKDEIHFFIKNYVSGAIADYQMSALAMAIFLNGMDEEETAFLLEAMIHSGEKLSWKEQRPQRIFADKHSTGGVGDKTSFIVLPLLIADGFDVPMVAGRGLGHTGGTLDKLESLPGLRTQVSLESFKKWILQNHGAFGAQTTEFVPADKKLYALRDVTATVDCIPLIAASIMSKKLAEDLDGLVLDVKYGNGAFMTTKNDAQNLGRILKKIGEISGCKVAAALTDMNQPLGRCAGNAVEIAESLDVLSGAGPLDTRELSLQLAAGAAAVLKNEDHEVCYARMKNHLLSGRALEIFQRTLIMQGADIKDVTRASTKWIKGPTKEFALYSNTNGIVTTIDTRRLGMALVTLGAGRKKVDDSVNPYVALTAIKKLGENVDSSEPLLICHVESQKIFEDISLELKNCFKIEAQSEARLTTLSETPLIAEWLKSS